MGPAANAESLSLDHHTHALGQTCRDAARPPIPDIVATNLRKSFPLQAGRIDVLSDVSCTINRGEFVSIAGPSGCGKSTFLKIVAGLITPDQGEVTLAQRPAQAGRRDVGILLQNPALLPWRNVLGNVMLPFRMFGEVSADAESRALDIIRMVGLEKFRSAYPWQLSGGMQQRTALARLFAYAPSIQLMDEPFGALDELTREHLNVELSRIHELVQKTVLFVTHSVQEAVLLSDRVLVMSPGNIIGEVTVGLTRPRRSAMIDDGAFADATSQVRGLLSVARG